MSVWYDVKCQGEQMFTKEHVPPWGDLTTRLALGPRIARASKVS